VNSSTSTAAAPIRSWYLVHTLAGMTVLFVAFAAAFLTYSFVTGQVPKLELPLAVRSFGALCVIALFWFWIRMLVDFFRERPPRFPVLWGWSLFLGSYLGALAYFWVVWRPRNRPSDT